MSVPPGPFQATAGTFFALACVVAAGVVVAGCGKKGPPLPPVIRLPAAPLDMSASRRGLEIELTLRVPNANTDGSRPGDIDRIEVFALTTTDAVTANDVIGGGMRVARLDVKAPRNPDTRLDPDDPESEKKLLEPTGLDQGQPASVAETLSVSDVSADATRVYAAIAVSTRDRRSAPSAAVAVPLVQAPVPPADSLVSYDDRAVTITWGAADGVDGYHVYELPPTRTGVTEPAAPAVEAEPVGEPRLTMELLTTPSFRDPRVEWGTERCYVVRAVRMVNEVGVESEPSAPTCVTPVDTFPPPPPIGLNSVPAVGAITIVWDGIDAEKVPDIAGYIVLRGEAPATTLTPITPTLITTTFFRDTVPADRRFVYAVQSVDTSGNRSEPSARIEESAR